MMSGVVVVGDVALLLQATVTQARSKDTARRHVASMCCVSASNSNAVGYSADLRIRPPNSSSAFLYPVIARRHSVPLSWDNQSMTSPSPRCGSELSDRGTRIAAVTTFWSVHEFCEETVRPRIGGHRR